MGTDRYATLHRASTPRAEARVRLAIVGIARSRKLIWHLHSLGHAWFSPSSCFGVPQRATPGVEELRLVAPLSTHPDVNVAVAALFALRSAATALPLIEGAPVRALFDVPDVCEQVRRALADERVLVRLSASRLFAEAPTSELRQSACELLYDDVYSVRWNAIMALASLAKESPSLSIDLPEALRRSAPKNPNPIAAGMFAAACSAVGISGT